MQSADKDLNPTGILRRGRVLCELLLVVGFIAGALDTRAQGLRRPLDGCFADPTIACLMEQAAATLDESGYPDPDALLEIAALLSGSGEIGRAQAMFMRALDTSMMMGWPELRGALFLYAAQMTVTHLSADAARTVLKHSEAVARDMELPDIRAMALQAIARSELDAGRIEQARETLEEALDTAVQLPWDEMRQSLFDARRTHRWRAARGAGSSGLRACFDTGR